MSTSKRLVSLLMALVLVVGIFAIPALAATADDTAEPYGVTTPCPRCGNPTRARDYYTYSTRQSKNECYLGYGHTHTWAQKWRETSCTSASCSYSNTAKVGSEVYWSCDKCD